MSANLPSEFRNLFEKEAPPPESTTVRGVASLCHSWLGGQIEAGELNNPCLHLSTSLREAAQGIADDVEQNTQLIPELREHLQSMSEAYSGMADALNSLLDFANEGDRDAFSSELAAYEEELNFIVEAQSELLGEVESGELKCPGCGEEGEEDVCPPCQLVRLYPDTSDTALLSERVDSLPESLAQTRRAVFQVVNGESSLPIVLDTLPALYDLFEESSLPEYQASLGIAGVDTLQSLLETRSLLALKQGWNQIYEAFLAIESKVSRDGPGAGTSSPVPQDRVDIDF